jgi:hypothetical protein
MKIICDTHALLFWADRRDRLSAQAFAAIENGRSTRSLACADISLTLNRPGGPPPSRSPPAPRGPTRSPARSRISGCLMSLASEQVADNAHPHLVHRLHDLREQVEGLCRHSIEELERSACAPSAPPAIHSKSPPAGPPWRPRIRLAPLARTCGGRRDQLCEMSGSPVTLCPSVTMGTGTQFTMPGRER